MIIELPDTTISGITNALNNARRRVGVSSGMVFTLLVVAVGRPYRRVLEASIAAGLEHPSRILLIVHGDEPKERLDAEIRVGEEIPGEIISLKFHGALLKHQQSVVMPLLLPDSPIVAWWPGEAPKNLQADQIGQLAFRRITDAMGASDRISALEQRCLNYSPGDTDLAWTRCTPFRALLAAALDEHPAIITHCIVEAIEENTSSHVLAAWLEDRLHVPVALRESEGPGITAVRMFTPDGEISVLRPDGLMATIVVPGMPHRYVALRRRGLNPLITEELRRLDADEVYAQTLQMLLRRFRRFGLTAAQPTGARR